MNLRDLMTAGAAIPEPLPFLRHKLFAVSENFILRIR